MKRWLILAILCLFPSLVLGQSVSSSIAAPNTQDLVSGLTVWLRGQSTAVSTTVSDLSGHGNNATWTGTQTGSLGGYCSPGKVSPCAFTFDGSTDYMTITNSTSLNTSAVVMMCAWIYSVTGNGTGVGWQGVISKRNSATNADYAMNFKAATFSVTTNGTAGSGNFTAFSLPVNTWTHVCGVLSGGGLSPTTLYVNGLPFGALQTSQGTITNTTKPVYIGADWAATDYFKGMLDDVRVYVLSSPPSPATIWKIYSGSPAGAPITVPRNSLEQVPAMGWNPWYLYGTSATEANIKNNCLAMSTSGMQAVGYAYCGVDEGWATSRDSSGRLVTVAALIPDGMAAVGAYIHGLGQKFTAYDGPFGCGVQPGATGYERQDAVTFAEWGVDYLKYDNCSGTWVGIPGQSVYATMGNALNATGRPIVYVVSNPYSNTVTQWGPLVAGNEAYDASDLGTPQFSTFMTILDSVYGTEAYNGPGHYGIPDYLGAGNGLMSDTEGNSQFSLMCLLAAPLFASNNLTSMSATTLATYKNLDAIAIDQDALGRQGKRVQRTACGGANCEVYLKQLSGTNQWALIFLNRDTAAETISTTWSAINGVVPAFANMTYTTCYNVWGNWPSSCSSNHCATFLGSLTSGYTATSVPSHGAVMLTLAP